MLFEVVYNEMSLVKNDNSNLIDTVTIDKPSLIDKSKIEFTDIREQVKYMLQNYVNKLNTFANDKFEATIEADNKLEDVYVLKIELPSEPDKPKVSKPLPPTLR